MYWMAHRVMDGTEEEVHVFVHAHGEDFPWPEDARRLPEEAPGRLIREQTGAIKPGGNRVRSYLDVLAPDVVGDSFVIALAGLIGNVERQPNPTVWVQGPVTIRFGCELALSDQRVDELKTLARAVWPDGAEEPNAT